MTRNGARIETASAVPTGDCGRFLFQLRDDIPGILYPGMIGLFGGHLEPGETALEGVCREVREELGVALPPDHYSILAECTVPAGGKLLAETVFHAAGVQTDMIEITEGRLLPLAFEGLPAHLAVMTPITCCAARILMDHGTSRAEADQFSSR